MTRAHLRAAPLDARREAFVQALEMDGVLSSQQAWRHYALIPNDLAGVRSTDRTAQPVHSQPGLMVQSRLFVSTARRKSWATTTLTHAAGVAEIRHLLGVGADADWRIETTVRRGIRHQPDAVWDRGFYLCAVEYDTGSYRTDLIRAKLGAYQDNRMDEVIWGAPSPRRCRNLEALPEFRDFRVLQTRWF
ncbi:hypothetical protein HNQ07_004689 [Deinococcus metalli]|uniref:Uncharacterized protein n=1 Tax=Deinococcus metalli TaxID=1141878 RepID=A0A7W8NQK9_9DEIO|nr:hypothetical protein [Deinococcus metalli]MBB5379174.1 hypothetical protein [Deinococcus metalli]GHF64697.1 hypothetical protein GCM10017781_45710 [Deinococcus metalli]